MTTFSYTFVLLLSLFSIGQSVGAPITCGVNAVPNANNDDCECLPGFRGKFPLTKGCYDTNECMVDQPCLNYENSKCVNTKGSYRCVCNDGYLGNPTYDVACTKKVRSHVIDVDTDVCKVDPTVNPCGDHLNSYCAATNSDISSNSYTCQCDEGYKGDPLNGIDCFLTCDSPFGSPCGPDLICKDTTTGYTCEKMEDIGTCVIPCSPGMECKVQFDTTQNKNVNKCVCQPGYYQSSPFFPCRLIPTP